jgi:hypothetical protein
MENTNTDSQIIRIRIASGANFYKVLARIKQYCGGVYEPETKTWRVKTTHHLRNADFEVVS